MNGDCECKVQKQERKIRVCIFLIRGWRGRRWRSLAMQVFLVCPDYIETRYNLTAKPYGLQNTKGIVIGVAAVTT